MNKKFSTLVVACMASATFTSAVAATLTNATRDVHKIETNKAYQLSNADGSKILVMISNGSDGFTLKLKTATEVTDLNSTLWEIKYSYPNGSASSPDFTFVNKATGLPLQVDPKKAALFAEGTTYSSTNSSAVEMAGSVSTWKWKDFVETQSSPFGTSGLVSHFAKDSVVTLVTGATPGTTTNGYAQSEDVYLVKAHANRSTWNGIHLRVAPAYAGAVTLSAKDLNTKLGTDPEGKSFQLSADPELKIGTNSSLGNIFTKTALRAWDLNYNTATNEAESKIYVQDVNFNNGAAGSYDGMLLQVIDNDAKKDDPYNDVYVMADTAYVEGMYVNDKKCVGFIADSIRSSVYNNNPFLNTVKPGRNNQAALFKFTYFASQDSIAIEVAGYNTKQETAEDRGGKITFWGGDDVTDANEVILNRLTDIYEITLGDAEEKANIRFTLGMSSSTNRVSKDNGVYVIKNTKGQFWAVPIYNTNVANATSNNWDAAEWVTMEIDAQDAMRMPAYQWVAVQKDTLTADMKKVSVLNLTNREFDKVVAVGGIQLRKNEGAAYYFSNEINGGKDSLLIDEVAADVIADEALGYLNLKDELLSVMTYKFNYLHSYAEDKFIGMMEDSILNVKDNELSFFMTEEAKANYGYTTPYVAGLKQLTRVTYMPVVKTANGERYIAIDEEGRYKLTDIKADAHKFYLKENNFYKPASKEAKQAYYAFIDLVKVGENDSTKMGSADQDLSVILRNQVLEETRTSAFAVVENNAPLYRRLNTALEGNDEGKDAPAYVKFQEQYVGDYLMDETNKKFQREGMNYLGIGASDIAKAGLSFYVRPFNIDNARGEEAQYLSPKAAIKPQYLIYVSDEAVEQVKVIPCDKEANHVDAEGNPTDAEHCSHAEKVKTNFNRYKLLVSFADSAKKETSNTVSDKQLYKFGKYTRVGFVDAIEFVKDSVIYILGKDYANVESEALDTAAIKKGLKGETKIDLKAAVKEDKHHNYTWSFRYIDPENVDLKAADEDEREFLFESMKYDSNDIAPLNGAWLKNQNNCLVLTDDQSDFVNAKTGSDNALIFRIEKGSKDDMATDNEVIATSDVTVIAGEGQLTIANAAGKKVVVSNILGQVVANTVLTSDNATIAAPQGVVVVAVEGEEAVKAIIK